MLLVCYRVFLFFLSKLLLDCWRRRTDPGFLVFGVPYLFPEVWLFGSLVVVMVGMVEFFRPMGGAVFCGRPWL